MTVNLATYIEQDTLLHRLNPAAKLGVAALYMAAATLIFDPLLLLGLAAAIVSVTWLVGQIPLPVLLRGLLPFFILGLGYLWMNALFPRTSGTEVAVLFHIGPLQVVAEGVEIGLILTARALAFGACSLFFISTTDPTDFILSLIGQLGVNPRLAYGVLAAYRFLPLLESELTQIRAAHQLRGLGTGTGLRGKAMQFYRYTLPLLAHAMRKAGRVANAMESRAFTGARDRTYYRDLALRRADWLFVGAALTLLCLFYLLKSAVAFSLLRW